jgi:GxxExxY protein
MVVSLQSLPQMGLFSLTRINNLTYKINGGAIAVHRRFGPGLFESVYHQCMEWELADSGLTFVTRQLLPLSYKGRQIDNAFEVDFFVENLVVVELKAVKELAPVHEAQVLTYLKLTNAPLGLLINFNVPLLKDGGIKRLVNPAHTLVDEFNPIERDKHRP